VHEGVGVGAVFFKISDKVEAVFEGDVVAVSNPLDFVDYFQVGTNLSGQLVVVQDGWEVYCGVEVCVEGKGWRLPGS